ncbi:short-chain fatty acyl-CoA regulator family protein [Devosia sp. 63-57]|uniref:helix-turn-helix domain-containing protein n=1 Tax=Devosia sp. 63-57 TaxID=1895751 RepID=UPI00086BB9E6|nr:short-chain fatty acyl-CoA regulator family protein [Devosia sp. 63-57]ODT48703.1 MAG: XRE family transcriptional regulator [Pelagibacterium sp. SCN 63-126]ODU85816.1 MAG: XRE family transcriptional regulator [Pelagibacterium sp. SCN 63-17]OJX41993.1 MAG: XRE family transcriptional regulator [Devosia sp. 63-57]
MVDTAESQIGGRIKRLRRQRRLNQADLAAALGISPSYLNLIEHNRRKVTVPLLFSIAGYFGVEPGELVDSDEGRLAGDLMEAFGDDLFADSDLTNLEIRDLATANPAAARAVLKLYDRYRVLASGGEAPRRDGEAEPYHLATDAISDFLQENANHFPALEDAAERVRVDIDNSGDSFDPAIRTYLFNVFGLEVRLASLPHGIARQTDPARRHLLVSDLLSAESANFLLAQQVGQMAATAEIEAVIAAAELPEGDAPALARNVLSAYFAAALLMPYAPFLRACRDYRYDIERLGRRFGASFEQVCHRMTTLQRKGAAGIPLHLVRTDIAGNISKRFSLSGIHIPRHSGACPRWNIYAAFLAPERINVQLSQMPDGQKFFCIARTITKGDYRYNAPRRYLSIGLGCAIHHAGEMIYSDGMDLGSAQQVVPIGVGCRICPRMECGQRAHPPADHRFRLDDNVRPESLYARMG